MSFEHDVQDISDTQKLIDCVSQALRRQRPNQRIVSFDQFRQAAFPRLQPASVPTRPEYLDDLLKSSDFRRRIAPLRLRYIAVIGGVTEQKGTRGGGECFAGYGAGGCLGFWAWDKEARIGATLLDLHEAQAGGRIEARTEGTAWFAIIGIFPLGLPSDPSQIACRHLGNRIADFIDSKQGPREK